MKNNIQNIFLKTILLVFISFSLNAQYKENKLKYDYHDYKYSSQDRYNPIIAGVASYFLPGTGQLYCNETLRGIGFMAGYMGAGIVTITSFFLTVLPPSPNFTWAPIFYVGAFSMVGIQIWSIADAVKVAMVNELARRDKKVSSTLRLSPSFQRIYGSNNISSGLGLTLSF